MAKELANTEQNGQQELEILGPIFHEEDDRARRERSVEMLQLLWNRRRFLRRVAGVGLVAATLIAFQIPKRFTSTARLMPPDQGPGATGMAMMAALAGKGTALGTLGSEMLGLKTSGDLFIGILQSRTVEDDLIAKFNLRKVYGAQRWEDARKRLAAETELSQDKKSEIITIQVSDQTAQQAQQLAAEYVQELNKVVTTLNTTSAHRERVFLEERLSQVQKDLESAEKDFSEFASKNTTIDIQTQAKAMIEAGASLEGQLIASQTELEGLRQIFTDKNFRVREAQAQVDELTRQMHKLGGKVVSGPADAHQDNGTLYPSIRQLPVLGVPYADLYRRMKVQEAVFETLTQQYELAKVEEAKETPSVKVLDSADLPEKKSFPPRLLIMFLGTMLALACGVICVLGRRAWETTEATDVRKVFANQVWTDIRATLPWTSVSGDHGTRERPVLNSPDDNHVFNESNVSGNGAGKERQ
jgi:uncharacterized protein involved in exopolysaccharide biosynthesis